MAAKTEILSKIGVGSGINTNELITALVEADSAAQKESLDSLEEKTQGQISAFGILKSNLKDFANDVYFLGHSNSLHPGLSIFENINYLSLLKNSHTQFKNKNDKFGILELNDIRVPELSNGQKRRVALSILSNCEKPLWILDEPLNSVDKNYKKIFMNMIQNHSKRNGISIISSHEVNDYSLDENVIIIDLNKI